MTKPKGVGRGGKRQNAGRPGKEKPATTSKPAAAIPVAPSGHDELVKLAYRMLKEIMGDPNLPAAPRVTAAKAVIAGSPGSAAGKKEAAHRAAAVAGAGTDWGDDLDAGRVN